MAQGHPLSTSMHPVAPITPFGVQRIELVPNRVRVFDWINCAQRDPLVDDFTHW